MTWAPPTISLEQLKGFDPCDDRLEFIAPFLANGPLDAAGAAKVGATLDDLIWIASAVSRSDAGIETRFQLWAADVAAHVLHLYENEEASLAPRGAIQTARDFLRGLATGEQRDAAWAAAGDAARDAAGDAARDAEKQWQLDRLIYWLTEENPIDLPLPNRKDT